MIEVATFCERIMVLKVFVYSYSGIQRLYMSGELYLRLFSFLFLRLFIRFYQFVPLENRKIILDLKNVIPFINSNLNDTPKNNFIFLNNSIEYAVSIPVSILETSAWLSALNKINNGCDTESQTPDTFNS